jgi:hypothetical protein
MAAMTTTVTEPDVRPCAARLRVVQFTGDCDRDRYDRFHEIRVQVFSSELGWQLRSGASEWHDPYDSGARFSMAETEDGTPVGTLRGLVASTAFPHRELFTPHLVRSGLLGEEAIIGTLNALAVLPQYRRRMFRMQPSASPDTASHALVASAMADLFALGVQVMLATVLGPVSARVFLRAGFQLLDAPRTMPGQDRFRVANVGLVTASGNPDDVNRLAAAAQYFADCDMRVRSLGTIDALFERG